MINDYLITQSIYSIHNLTTIMPNKKDKDIRSCDFHAHILMMNEDIEMPMISIYTNIDLYINNMMMGMAIAFTSIGGAITPLKRALAKKENYYVKYRINDMMFLEISLKYHT